MEELDLLIQGLLWKIVGKKIDRHPQTRKTLEKNQKVMIPAVKKMLERRSRLEELKLKNAPLFLIEKVQESFDEAKDLVSNLLTSYDIGEIEEGVLLQISSVFQLSDQADRFCSMKRYLQSLEAVRELIKDCGPDIPASLERQITLTQHDVKEAKEKLKRIKDELSQITKQEFAERLALEGKDED